MHKQEIGVVEKEDRGKGLVVWETDDGQRKKVVVESWGLDKDSSRIQDGAGNSENGADEV